MKTRIGTPLATVVLTVLVSAGCETASGQTDSDLLGGWVVSSWEAPAGQRGPTPQRGLFLFTESGHYSMMFVIGGARDAVSPNASDADLAAAYNPFVANSGRYSVSGDEITYEAFVAKDPAYMSQFEPTGGAGNAQTITFNVEDGTLTLEFASGDGPMQGSTATLRRPGEGE